MPWRIAQDREHTAASRRVLQALHLAASLLLTAEVELNASARAPTSFDVRRWTSEDGLPANRISALAQSGDGYLWVGTWFGLARFDGVRFVVFNPANTPELPAETISQLAVDRRDGALWIATMSGLCRYKEGRFERLSETNAVLQWRITKMVAAQGGGVWVREGGRVACWPAGGGRGVRVGLTFGERVVGMWEAGDGALELMTYRRAVRIGRDGTITPGSPPPALTANETWNGACPQDSRGRFWISTSRELRRLSEGQWQTVRHLPERVQPADLFLEDRSGAMWVGHGGEGLWRYTDESQDEWELGDRGAQRSVDCLLEDREGHIWAGTAQGLFRLRPRQIRAISQEDGLPHRVCWSVSEAPDGAMWVETGGGVARIRDEIVQTFTNEPLRIRTPGILVDRESRVWLGHKRHGVISWRPGFETNRFWSDSNSSAEIDVESMALDRAGRVWIGSSRGVVWFEQGQPAAKFGEHGLPTNVIRAIYQTRDGTMWFGTRRSGLVQWRPRAAPPAGSTADPSPSLVREVRRFTRVDGLADDRPMVFHEDIEGALWIGTYNGLSRFKGGRFCTLRTEQGLFDNLINWMEEDDFGRIWFSCNRGVFRMNRTELNEVADGRKSRAGAVIYGTADGMLNPETNGEHAPAGSRGQDGRIWFPTTDGVVVIDPGAVRESDIPPTVVIEQVMADGEVVWQDGRAKTVTNEEEPSEDTGTTQAARPSEIATVSRGLRLAPGRARDLQIRYTANSFLDPQRNRFQYRLVNHDTGWRDETVERLAVFTNLRPGAYRFELRAANAHGCWSDVPAALAFTLAPRFQETWTFRALVVAAVFGLAAGFTAYRLRWQHRWLSARHAQALAEERARIARDLHDDLGSALTGVALELDVARQFPSENQGTTGARLGETAARVRALAERMREVVWAVNPRCDTVPSVANFLEQQAGTLLSAGGVRGRFEFPEDIPVLPLDSAIRHQLALGVREALTNVVRHARASEVVVGIAVCDGTLQVWVRDDGRGFNAASAGTEPGHGLHNLRTRLQKIGGTVGIESNPRDGTRVEFRVPLVRPPKRKEIP